ncbi:uncharacterized protein [Haliotis cracherodii]|uniref:uncharacterized protein n=1 Tax=Haliotis cracherodii TaxID=6455 RepID=UPI0039E8ED1D
MMRCVCIAIAACLVLVLHVSDTRGANITTNSITRDRTNQWDTREVCNILNKISYLLGAIVALLCFGFVGTQALVYRAMTRKQHLQDEPHIYNTFQTDRQISRTHNYTRVVPVASTQAQSTDISSKRHSYVEIIPPDSAEYIRPVCQQCPTDV